MKKCWRCQKDLPLSSFWKDAGRKDGLCHACKECMVKADSKWRDKNRKRYNNRQAERRKICKDSWRPYFQAIKNCECCGKQINFAAGSAALSICFDHRRGDEVIKGNPTNWLQHKMRTPENQLIWESCDFGKLCQRCNAILPPSSDRKRFVKMLYLYTDA